MGQPFPDQSLSGEQIQGVMALMLLKLKQELAQYSVLFEQVLTHLDKIEARDSNPGVNQAKKYASSSKQPSRDHPALKVSQASRYL
jgi:hypothetical protein